MFQARILLAISLVTCAAAQPAGPQEFEAVAIKPYVPEGTTREACNWHGGPGLLYYVGCTLSQLAEMAYDLKRYEFTSKAGAWAENDPYVIQARAAGAIQRPEMKRMLRTVLALRFHMVSHWEERDAPAYLLQTGSHGVKLQAATKTDRCGELFFGGAVLRSDCVTLTDIAQQLQSMLAVPVVNQIAGNQNRYQLNLEWAKEDDLSIAVPAAIQDFGLVLKAGRAPLRMLVIDSAARPDAN
jgi:uncharacterized protein (TIGR03435 family)